MKQKGSALLIVLIAVAIMLVLYGIQMKSLFGPRGQTQPVGVEERPWQLEHLLADEGEKIKLPRKPKPRLSEPLRVSVDVTRNNETKGTAAITFKPDGHIDAVWDCRYGYDEKTISISAEMAGNINVRQTYEDENGRDKSRLFFIAKGHYLKTSTTATIGTEREKGKAWLLGWLAADGTAEGHITITTDETWSAAYAFSTQIPRNEKSIQPTPAR